MLDFKNYATARHLAATPVRHLPQQLVHILTPAAAKRTITVGRLDVQPYAGVRWSGLGLLADDMGRPEVYMVFDEGVRRWVFLDFQCLWVRVRGKGLPRRGGAEV